MTLDVERVENSQTIQTHLGIIQGVISRMASNSSSCKSWSITVVTALLVLIADKNKPELIVISYIPIVLFAVLDAYYLALERGFRKSYSEFVHKIHTQKLIANDLFTISPIGNIAFGTLKSLVSFSILPMYLTLFLMVKIGSKYFF
jgi:hypothetical protein